jgi:hypothetical protein
MLLYDAARSARAIFSASLFSASSHSRYVAKSFCRPPAPKNIVTSPDMSSQVLSCVVPSRLFVETEPVLASEAECCADPGHALGAARSQASQV